MAEENKKDKQGKEKKSKKTESKIELEREYIIPLKRSVLKVPKYKRAKKAIKTIKEFLAKHMKVENRDLKKVKIDKYLNNEVWFRGIKKPANKIKVKVVKKDGIVYAELAEMPEAVVFAKQKEESRNKAVKGLKSKSSKKEKEEATQDKDKDGIEDKVEEKEDKKAGTEQEIKIQKEATKTEKHTSKGAHHAKTAPVRKTLR